MSMVKPRRRWHAPEVTDPAPTPRTDHTVLLWEPGDVPHPAVAITVWTMPVAGLTAAFGAIVESPIVFAAVLVAGGLCATLPVVFALSPRRSRVRVRVRSTGLMIRGVDDSPAFEGHVPWSDTTLRRRWSSLRLRRDGHPTIAVGGDRLPELMKDITAQGIDID